MNIQVFRLNSSSYQKQHFFQEEKLALESLTGVKYVNSITEIEAGSPFVLLTNTHTDLDNIPEIITKNTVLMIHPNSGYDNFSVDFLNRFEFPVILGNEVRAKAVSEYILSCLFHHFTPLKNHQFWQEDRSWNRRLISNQKVLILGHGHIGKIVFNGLSALCEDITVFDPFEENLFSNKNLIGELNDSHIKDVDVLILANGLNKSSHAMVDQDFLKKLSSDCVIVNAARGPIIKEGDLVQFLEKKPDSFAYLDVFEKEPFAPGYLSELPNVTKSSHIAGVYKNLNNSIINFEKNVLSDFIGDYLNGDRTNFVKKYGHNFLKNKLKDNQLI